MHAYKSAMFLKQLSDFDLSVCLLFNRSVHRDWVRYLFKGISRLGDGVVWYVLMLILPVVDGQTGLEATFHMLLVGVLGLAIYKWMKRSFIRERPFVSHESVQLGAAPLDRCSFPSGHTLHAVGFTTVVMVYYPALGWLLIPFALLVAASRMVLGLHYPSDVLIGALIGLVVSVSSLSFI